MTLTKHIEETPISGQGTTDKMAEYGITRVPVDYFHYKEFRYTNLEDAIAQAKRQNPAAPSGHLE